MPKKNREAYHSLNKRKLKKRQQEIFIALKELGGLATTRQIAAMTGLHVNGVSQSLGSLAMYPYVEYDSGKNGDTKWKIK